MRTSKSSLGGAPSRQESPRLQTAETSLRSPCPQIARRLAAPLLRSTVTNCRNPDYVPPSKPYELVDLTKDLVQLARYLLVPGGRLVFFLPTVHDEYDEVDIPSVEGMEEIKFGEGSVQSFGRWGRRVSLSRIVGHKGVGRWGRGDVSGKGGEAEEGDWSGREG